MIEQLLERDNELVDEQLLIQMNPDVQGVYRCMSKKYRS